MAKPWFFFYKKTRYWEKLKNKIFVKQYMD